MRAIAGLLLAASLILAQADSSKGDYFDDADSDADEVLTFIEIKAVFPGVSQSIFDALDVDRNGVLSLTEFEMGVNQGYLQER